MKILTVIASYGTNNDQYLQQLIDEYAKMPYQIDIVVVSNIPKSLGSGIEVVVGLPSKNPWSLPFAHKKIFIERQNQYDLFIYSEDDTLISQHNIEAFLQATAVLKPNEIAGFLRTEQAPDGTIYFSTVHNHYHWDPHSVCRRGDDVFAFFSNEHGACYLLTQDQLRQSIASGGFDVNPHEGKYDMLVSAATDPYTQCGYKKLICITRLLDFTCKHLTNKYIGKTGLEKSQFDVQINALLNVADSDKPVPPPVCVESKLPGTRWIKSYYEPCRNDLLSMVPKDTKKVLSIGCGWGKTEAALLKENIQVAAVPLDIVIGKLAETKGVRIIPSTLEETPKKLAGEKFDVLLISGLLHLIEEPVALLQNYRELLTDNGVIILSCPNVMHLAITIRHLMGQKDFQGIDDFHLSSVHRTSGKLVTSWLRSAGFIVEQTGHVIEGRWKTYDKYTLGLAKGLWAYEFILAAKKL
jgi:2-polyprenyl-3-methyl-5-hydroxy-6-metoxy-1,4-benzoquinol methylase